jgi:hypothetical protein
MLCCMLMRMLVANSYDAQISDAARVLAKAAL